MNILYHLATLRPKMPQAEAISQEVMALQKCFGGDLVYVNPNQPFPLYIPRLLFGFHRLQELWDREANVQLHHFYNPDPFPFPYLRMLRRPVIYYVTCGVRDRRPNVAFLSSLAAVAVSDDRSLKRLEAWGVKNALRVQPGIDTSRFTCSPLPLQSEIKLMVGSAPWTPAQFKTKGVDALLETAQQMPQLRLVFMWRGVLADEMERRVRRLNLEERAVVLNRQVDVNQVLANVHASITLASDPAIIRSYPHSLLDSLAAGKPVLVSGSIPMSDYVQQTGCGQVVERVTPADILTAIQALTRNYNELQQAARRVGQDFSQQNMINSWRLVYEHVLGSTGQS